MPEPVVRKTVSSMEEIFHEGGPLPATTQRRAWIMTVIENPFAGRYVQEITGFMDDLKPLGLSMAGRLIEVLGGDASLVQGYGKGAIVGTAGEVEHGALWHAPGGYAMRELLDDARAIVPSAKKVGAPGVRMDVPVTHINASYVRSHFDSVEVGVHDSPRANELAVVLVMTTGGRIHARSGGLAVEDVKGEDGLR